MNFELDNQYITSVSIIKTGSMYDGMTELSDELIKILKGNW